MRVCTPVHHQCSLNCKCNFIFNISIPPSLSIVKYSNGCTPDPSQYSLATEYLEGVFTPNIVTDWPQGPCSMSQCVQDVHTLLSLLGVKLSIVCCTAAVFCPQLHHGTTLTAGDCIRVGSCCFLCRWSNDLGGGRYAYCWILLPSHIRSWARGRSKLLRHSPKL